MRRKIILVLQFCLDRVPDDPSRTVPMTAARGRLDGALLVKFDRADAPHRFSRSPCPHSGAASALDDDGRIVDFDGV